MGVCISRKKPHIHTEDSKSFDSSHQNQNLISHTVKAKQSTDFLFETKEDAMYAVVQEKPKTKADINLISTALSKHFIFNSLTDEQRNKVIAHMKFYILEPNEIVFEQGSPGSAFFVIAHGQLEVIIDGITIKTLRSQESFGELALLHDTPRTATIKTIVSSALWGVDRRTFRTTLEQITALNYAENKALIESIPVFKILSNSQVESLVSTIHMFLYNNGEVIVKEGDVGDLLFIIKQGSVICSQDGNVIKTLSKGDYFGEQALLNNSIRTATITAAGNVRCLTIGREELTNLFGTSLQMVINKNSQRIAFDKNEYLNKLTKKQFEQLMSCAEIKEIKGGERVIAAGEMKKDQIVIVLKGELENSTGDILFKAFDIIGLEEAINNSDTCFNSDCFAKNIVDLALIERIAFFTAIGGNYEKVTENNKAIQLLKKIQIFKHLTENQYEKLIELLKVESFRDNHTIFLQDEPGESLYLIKSGKVEVLMDGQNVRSITKDDYFGERSLLFDNFRSASVIAKGDVICWVLYKNDFLSILDDQLRGLLLKRIELQDENIKLSDLQVVKTLAVGNFGNVFLVAHKRKRTCYALKTVDRRKIEAFELESSLVLERKILLQTDHILISKLIKTFKDPKRVYFLEELIQGTSLYSILQKLDVIMLADAKFYSACIFLMLEHLHERDIIHRDLQPLNIMIDEEGYPKLIDFGSAKIIKSRTYTIIDSQPHYMAPEIITGHGYSHSADYWSAGIILYELLYAVMPFGNNEKDPYIIYDCIEKGKLEFPEASGNQDKVNDLIRQLLSKNPAVRLGGGFENLKRHTWFLGINWEKVERREMPTPYVPKVMSLENDVNIAMKAGKSLEDIVAGVERTEDIPKFRRNLQKVNSDWDKEFSS